MTSLPPMTPQERTSFIRNRLPEQGLFDGKEWRIAPHAFPLSPSHLQQIEHLGPLLHRFNQACNLLYRQSMEGRQPSWIAELLDQGKPPELVELSRHRRLKGHVPAIIRPDLILTEKSFAITELDSVPGGIGLTAWLGETYAAMGDSICGGAQGMREGFAQIFPEGHVLISKEASTYRPEMEWLIGADRIHSAETYKANGTPLYRFFECFDWMSLSSVRKSWDPTQPMTPPLKPFLEEKLWLALFWSPSLQEFWRQHLSEKGQHFLQQFIPYSWVMDPTPLPPHAVFPQLEIQQWEEMKHFSQKQRDLILKISGFSPLAWGARSVKCGSDLSSKEWSQAIDEAIQEFSIHPRILQRFAKGDLFDQNYLDRNETIQSLTGRARVCPYYFVANDHVTLGGILVTHCPADKKLLHGMSDAIISPATVMPSETTQRV